MFDISKYRKKMEGVIERLQGEMGKLRTGRAHVDMLSGVKVEAYGQWAAMNQVANVTVGDATMLVVTPFDPGNISAISAAIRADSSLGLNPSDDGRIVRVPIPALTEQRRREIVKTVAGKVEEARVGIRSVREDARKEVKSITDLSEDARKRSEKEIDGLAKEFTGVIDKLFTEKEAEVMKV